MSDDDYMVFFAMLLFVGCALAIADDFKTKSALHNVCEMITARMGDSPGDCDGDSLRN